MESKNRLNAVTFFLFSIAVVVILAFGLSGRVRSEQKCAEVGGSVKWHDLGGNCICIRNSDDEWLYVIGNEETNG